MKKSYAISILAAIMMTASVSTVHADAVPMTEQTDGCTRIQGSQDCYRSYGLTEKESPDAWNYDRIEYSKKQRWYHVASAPAPKAPRIVRLEGIRFEFNSAKINPSSYSVLDKNISELQVNRKIKFKIVGHTDSKGSDEYNARLSEERATSVYDYFVSKGVDASRMGHEGRGESDPAAPNTTSDGKDNPDGRALNRRIELHIWDK